MQKLGIEQEIIQLEKQIGELEADDDKLPYLKDRLEDAHEAITVPYLRKSGTIFPYS